MRFILALENGKLTSKSHVCGQLVYASIQSDMGAQAA